MNVFVVFPTANTAAANVTLEKWHERGYRSIVAIDLAQEKPQAEFVLSIATPYPGFSVVTNMLIRYAMDEGADLIVVAGDDIDPAPDFTAADLAARFFRRFPGGFGVAQPTADAYGALAPDAPYPACVSPWIGREFARRINGGLGVYHAGYRDLFPDAELWSISQRLGVLDLWPDVTQYHHHWTRGCEDTLPKGKRARITNNARHDRELFIARREAGFPGNEPIDQSR